MGKRSIIATTEAEVAALSLPKLNQQIHWMELRAREDGPIPMRSSLRKSAFKQLLWLEAQRERLHGIAAPKRKFQE
jgi:hypothetical protein